jgi:hypothetical protein
MRMKPLLAIAFGAALTLGACASSIGPFKANDTGGIVAWSPEAELERHEIAREHCAQHGKLHRITSVNRRHGDYIGFACYWPRGYEPNGVILDSAY